MRDWINLNLSETDRRLFESGGGASWPWPTTPPDQLRFFLSTVVEEMGITMAEGMPTIRKYYYEIMKKTHPDKNDTQEYRTYYASLATTALVARCYALDRGETLPSVRAMPRLLVTPFEGATAWNARYAPPSAFEFHAANIARRESGPAGVAFEESWARINTMGNSHSVIAAETAFWNEMHSALQNPNQIFYGSFFQREDRSWGIFFEGQSGNFGNPQQPPDHADPPQHQQPGG